jgi:hypothetical protein
MNTRKFKRTKLLGGQLFFLLAVLLLTAGLFVTQAPSPAIASIRIEDPTETDPISVGDEPQYTPPAGGFSWAMEKRYGLDVDRDGIIDSHWNPTSMTYNPAYIYPTAWKITFNGCQTGNDYYQWGRKYDIDTEYDYEYQWKLGETILTTVSCRPTIPFTDKQSRNMELTVTKMIDGSTTTFPIQQIQVKDYFIVAIGDSYGSGQGNPDIEQVVEYRFPLGWNVISPAQWQDERCQRSANSAASLAAIALEASDPHSSVTFISFACTGATIYTDSYDPIKTADETWIWGNRGSGLLGPHRGEITDVPFSEIYTGYIKPQMQQVQDALNATNGQDERSIDALLISAGGNDMKFGPIITWCIGAHNCWFNDLIKLKLNPITDPIAYTLYDTVTRAVGDWTGEDPPAKTIPEGYDQLGAAINALHPKPINVYVTQYPDPTINDRGVANEASETTEHHCRMLDDVFWPDPYNVITDAEATTASHHAQTKLNTAIRESVTRLAGVYTQIHWQFVDGMSVFDVDNDPAVAGKPGLFKGGPNGGPGHGYCASDNWIRRADESELLQGPVNNRSGSMGTMHPNYSGLQAVKSRILRYMMPDLTGHVDATPVFTFYHHSEDGLNSQPGLNGWYTAGCDLAGNCYPRVGGHAVAYSSEIPLIGASVSVNDTGGCSVPGVTCKATLNPNNHRQVVYYVNITATGAYRFHFNAKDEYGRVSFLQQEIKVDLEDPVLALPIGPFEVNGGSSVVLSASIATDASGAPLHDDMLVDYDWDLNNDNIFEVTDEQPTFDAANITGPATIPIKVKVTDRAGRTATASAEVHVLYVGPMVTIDGAPATSPEGTAINLTSTASGSGDPETFGYAWEVKKNGTSYQTGFQTDFSFTPNDNGSYEVSLSVTDNTDLTGIAANQTIDVTNVAPTVAIIGAPASVQEGSTISLNKSVTDPGTEDTFTYSWEVRINGETLQTFEGPDFQYTPDQVNSYEVILRATDDDGGVGRDSVVITVTPAPLAVAIDGAPATSPEGTAIQLTSTVSGLGTADTITYAWEVKKNGTSYLSGVEAGFSFTPDDNASYEVSLQVTAGSRIATAVSQTIDVTNVAPELVNPSYSPAEVNEGESITISGGIVDKGTKDTLTLEIDWGDGSPRDIQELAAGTSSFSASHVYADDNPSGTASDQYTFAMMITDKDNASNGYTGKVTVNNVAPSLTISAPANGALFTVNTAVNLSAALTDPSSLDILTCTINWGDDNTESGSLTAGNCTGSHSYPAVGVYTIQVTGADDDMGSKTESVMAVVYDPSAGFVTGGGWIDSPAGAFKPEESLAGKANFGFVSKYLKGASVPTGHTAFEFKMAGLSFSSQSYEWLVVNQSGTNAQFKGSGLINGAADSNGNAYQFMLWAGDGAPDTFRIRIWWEDANGEHDVYDNGVDQPIGGGSIVVHTKK